MHLLRIVTLGVLILAFLPTGCGYGGSGVAPTPPRLLGTIQTATLKATDQGEVELASGDDRITLLLVWATYAPDSVSMLSTLEALHRDHPGKIRAVAASIQWAKTVIPWLESRRQAVEDGDLTSIEAPTYPVVTSEGATVELIDWADRPTLWFLSGDGLVLDRLDGLQDAATILARVEALRAASDASADAIEKVDSVPSPLGGCVLERRDGEVPSDLRRHTEIVRDDRYAPFTKHLVSGGIIFIATDDVEDSFMTAVGDLHAAMFDPMAPGIDRGLQDAVLTSMFEARTAIPMWKGEEPDFPDQVDWSAFDRLTDRLSICDAIFQLDPRDRASQPMEVVEHLLHHLNMVGIHEVFPDEWGITTESTLHRSMQQALDEAWYVVDYLDEFDDESEAQRVLLQEYSYWVISTEWDLQRPFGPDAENGEWNLSDPERFRSLQPELHAAFDRTIPKVLTPPNRAALAAFAE